MIIKTTFNIGNTVYLKTDTDQCRRIITCIQITPNDILYQLSSGTTSSWHYDFELTTEKDYSII